MAQAAVRQAKPRTNDYTPDPSVEFDPKIAELMVRYGRMLAARGYIHNALGGIVVRARHPGYPDGVAYVKPAGISMEEVTADQIVITDIPEGRLLFREGRTSPGHQLNREILRLRPDINAVIHVHHDETIALLASGAFDTFKHCSITLPYILHKPPHIVQHDADIEQDTAPIKTFIQNTNCVLMKRHGLTALGRSVSDAYHRLNSVTAEIRRALMMETLAAGRGAKPTYVSDDEVKWMYATANRIALPYLDDDGAIKYEKS